MPDPNEKYAHVENVKNLKKKIEVETDPARLAALKALLKEELERQRSASKDE